MPPSIFTRCLLPVALTLSCGGGSPVRARVSGDPLHVLRLRGMALRPVAAQPPAQASQTEPPPQKLAIIEKKSSPNEQTHMERSAATFVPGPLGRVREAQLLAGRLGRPPSLGVGCAPVGTEGTLLSCMGQPLQAPLNQAFVTELAEGQRVVRVIAEESYSLTGEGTAGREKDAQARFKDLLGRLSRAYGPPVEKGDGRQVFDAGPYRLTLELCSGLAGLSHVYLQLDSLPPRATASAGPP